VAIGSEGILNGPKGVETKLPGPVADRESVRVGLDLSGAPDAVVVSQRLRLSGLGDYRFKVPGPATDVEALPGSEAQPGLRKGAVLWQGFSPGHKVLGARLHLDPRLEAFRLPLRFSLALTVGGDQLDPGERGSGPLRLELRVTNTSALPVGVANAPADPAELAPVLDRVVAALARAERPGPGSGGVPSEIPVLDRPRSVPTPIESPFRVGIRISFPARTLRDVSARGGEMRTGPRGVEIRADALLGGGMPLSRQLTVTGLARRMPLPKLRVEASPSPPAPAVARPPTGGTWVAALERDPASLDGRDMLATLVTALWQVARERPFDAYLGNPDPTGPAQAGYVFVLDPVTEGNGGTLVSAAPGVRPFGIVWFALAVALLLVLGTLAWARS
jgi:hypothetical protein